MQRVMKAMILIIVTVLFPQTACDSTEPDEQLRLSVEDVSCTEVWLNVEGVGDSEFILERDGIAIENFSVLEGNIIYNDSLQPSTTYTYQVSSIQNQAASNEVKATTLDTTSSNYTWEKFYFGNIGSNLLKDIAIVDENNIWAVGDIEIQESGKESQTYALAKWNGITWKLEQVEFAHYPNTNKRPGKLNAIFVLDKENIFVATASQLLKWENDTWIEKAQFATTIPFDGQINAMWGNTVDNIYCVGNNGAIYHYYGTGWKKFEKVTDLDFQDIWGDYDERTGKWEILAVASDRYENSGNKLLKIEGEEVTELSTTPIEWSIFSCWFSTNRKYIVAGSGIYKKNKLDETNWSNKVLDISNYTIFKVRGNSINDIVVVGGFGEFQHYNGFNWRSHYEMTQIEGNYRSVSVKGNIVVSVGQHNTQAVITIGRR